MKHLLVTVIVCGSWLSGCSGKSGGGAKAPSLLGTWTARTNDPAVGPGVVTIEFSEKEMTVSFVSDRRGSLHTKSDYSLDGTRIVKKANGGEGTLEYSFDGETLILNDHVNPPVHYSRIR